MTLLDRSLARGFDVSSDPIIAARIERHLRRIQPDPLFRQRLRSIVVNRYVATREGLAVPVSQQPVRPRMGMLGRGVLYASLLTAVSVTAVGAASQGSLPGDALYGVKLGVEQFRLQVAPPSVRDDLAALALDERLDEVEALASAGRWEFVPEAASRAAAAEAALAALAPGDSALALLTGENSMDRHAERLQELMATAPASALDGLRRALAASTAVVGAVGSSDHEGAPASGTNANDSHASGAPGTAHDPRGGQSSGKGDVPAGASSPTRGGSSDGNGSNPGVSNGGQGGGDGGPSAAPTESPAPRPTGSPSESGGGDGQDGQGDRASGNRQ